MTNDYKEHASNIDWDDFKPPEDTCYCRCGVTYRSHAKIDMSLRRSISQKPCPGCGSHGDLKRVSSDPEIMILRG